MESSNLFPEGMEDATRALIAALNGSKNSYSVRVFRYAGESEYRAEIGINELTSTWPVEPPPFDAPPTRSLRGDFA